MFSLCIEYLCFLTTAFTDREVDTTVPVPLVRPVGLADDDTEEEIFEEDPPEEVGKKHVFWFPPLSRYCFNQFFFTNLLWQDVSKQSKKRSIPVKSENVKKAKQNLNDAKALSEKRGPSSSARPWRSDCICNVFFLGSTHSFGCSGVHAF